MERDQMRNGIQNLEGIVAQLQVHNPNTENFPHGEEIQDIQYAIVPPEKFSFDAEECLSLNKAEEKLVKQINSLLLYMGSNVNKVL